MEKETITELKEIERKVKTIAIQCLETNFYDYHQKLIYALENIRDITGDFKS